MMNLLQNNLKQSLFVGLLTLLWSTNLQAQDPVYSQFFAAPMQLNPALTGLLEGPVIGINYRNQWPNIPNAYATYAISYSQYAPSIQSGFGALIEADVAGDGIYANYRLGLFYAYDIRFNKKFYIRTGLEANFVNSRLAWNKLVFLDQLDVNGPTGDPSNEAIGASSINYVDFGAGLMVNTPYFYAGFALKHLNAPQEQFLQQYQDGSSELPLRYSLHVGSKILLSRNNKLGDKTFLLPNILFTKQRQFHQLNLGAQLRHGLFLGGIAFRHTFTNADAVIFMLGIQHKIVKIGYSYDLTLSSLGVQSGGAHEVSLIFHFGSKNKPFQSRYNDCLQIFR